MRDVAKMSSGKGKRRQAERLKRFYDEPAVCAACGKQSNARCACELENPPQWVVDRADLLHAELWARPLCVDCLNADYPTLKLCFEDPFGGEHRYYGNVCIDCGEHIDNYCLELGKRDGEQAPSPGQMINLAIVRLVEAAAGRDAQIESLESNLSSLSGLPYQMTARRLQRLRRDRLLLVQQARHLEEQLENSHNAAVARETRALVRQYELKA